MGPNIRYLAADYWDFYDYYLPLSHLSLEEGGCSRTMKSSASARFLPYTTRSPLPQHPSFVALYLAVPLAWRIFGKQFLVVARKAAVVKARA